MDGLMSLKEKNMGFRDGMIKNSFRLVLLSDQKGSILIGLIITMVIFGILGAGMVSLFSSSTMSQLGGNFSQRAYYLAESGFNYAASEFLNTSGEAAKDNTLEALNTQKTFTLLNNDGKFELGIYPYYFKATKETKHGKTKLSAKVTGSFPPELTLSSGYLKIGADVESYSEAVQSGSDVAFTISSPGGLTNTVLSGDTIYSVSHVGNTQTITNGNNSIDLEVSGSADAFPDINGNFRVEGAGSSDPERFWGYMKRDGNTLTGIMPMDDPNGTFSETIQATNDIILEKFVRIDSTGIFAGTDRQISYYTPIGWVGPGSPAGKETFHDTFDDKLDNWFSEKDEQIGKHEVKDVDKDKALKVKESEQWGLFNPQIWSLLIFNWAGAGAELATAWQAAGYCLSYDLQTKIYIEHQPKSFMAGMGFRLQGVDDDGDGDADDMNSYGLSYMRMCKKWKTWFGGMWINYDGIDSDFKPSGVSWEPEPVDPKKDDKWYSYPAIVLWERDGGSNKWLAYKSLSAGNLPDFAGLQVRIIEAYPLAFNSGGPSPLLYADMIYIVRGTTKIGTARVNGTPIQNSGSWGSNNASGLLTLSNISLEDGMHIQSNDFLQVDGEPRARAAGSLGSKKNYIRAYYGTVSGQGTPNSIPTDTNRRGDPRVTVDGQAVHWPVDDISAWAADNDYFTLVKWDGHNTGVSYVPATGYQTDAVIVENNPTFVTPDSGIYTWVELGLNTHGDNAESVFFDDFAIQWEGIFGVGHGTGFLPPIQQ